jgi:protein-tyrosine phosphatase
MSQTFVECFYLEENKHQLFVKKESKEINYNVYRVLSNEIVWLFESSEVNKTFECSFDRTSPIVFQIEFDDGEVLNFGHRILPIHGMYNFRDMGGYPTTDGKHVKWNLLYRGDHLNNLKPEGQLFLDNTQLKSIIDLRGDSEIIEYPNLGVQESTKQYVFSPAGVVAIFAGSLQNDEKDMKNENFLENAKQLIKKDKNAAINAMIDQQIQFVHNETSRNAFSQMLHLLATEDNAPSYIHCKGGKDRTGFASLLILGLLGVDEEYIKYDYMLTKKAREKKNQAYYQKFLQMSNDVEVAQFMYSIFDTQEIFIQSAIDEIKKEFGSIGAYARFGLGIKDEEVQQLRTMYLE